MVKQEKSIQLILGCGEKGMIWQPDEENVVLGKVDTRIVSGSHHNFILGDVLALPFQSSSVNRIYGDFILNAVRIRGLNYQEIAENPFLIYCLKACPQKITAWVEKNFMEVPKCRRNLEQFRLNLRQTALEEMWRVLAMDGKIEIIDHEHVTDWVCRQGLNNAEHSDTVLTSRYAAIDVSDFKRSHSLEKVISNGEPIRKIILRKTLRQLPLFNVGDLEMKINGKESIY